MACAAFWNSATTPSGWKKDACENRVRRGKSRTITRWRIPASRPNRRRKETASVLRVAFLCDHLDLGGQELSCLAVLRGLDRSRFAPYLYAFRPGALLPEARALDIPIVLGHDKPGADETWSARDEAARQRYQHELGPRLRADRIDVGLVYAWRDAVAAARA